MKVQIVGYTFVFVIVLNSLSCEANRNYAIGDIDDIITKRRYQRRNLLESFCARRCNRGMGGNVCRCNGFHFAGKRASSINVQDVDEDKPTEFPSIYKLLSDSNNALLNPEEDSFSTDDMLRDEEKTYKSSLSSILSELLKTVKIRTYDDELKHMIDDYLTPESSPRDI